MSCPCTSRAVSTSAALSATSLFHTAPFSRKMFPNIICKAFLSDHLCCDTCREQPFCNGQTTRPMCQYLYPVKRYIWWNTSVLETVILSLPSSPRSFHLLPLTPVRLRYAGLSYPHIAMAPAVGYCTGAGKLLGSLMSWGRDGGLSTDSSATTVEITWISFTIPRVPPFPSLPPSLYFVSVDKSLNGAFKKTTVAKH